jgi:histidyl-tRNA synthetase
MDAEHIMMTARLWKRLGLQDVTLELNTLGSGEDRARHRARLVHYLERNLDALDEDSRRRLQTNPLRVLDSKNPTMQALIEAAPKLLDDLDEDSLKHFEALQLMLREAEVTYAINPRLVRGLDYYNFTVFEWVTTRLGAQGTVCAGGRYDGLVAQIGGKPAPACGFAMGVERLLALLEEQQFAPPQRPADAYVVHQGEAADRFAVRVAEMLRERGLHAVLHCGGGGFKAQMKKADGSGARYAVIIGDDEAAAGEVSLKPLRELGEQARLAVTEAADVMAG